MNRKWRIKILQYECNHPAIAPEGCLQVLLWMVPVWFLESFERSQLQCVGCLHVRAKWAIWLGCNQKIVLTAFAIFEFYFDCNIAHLLLTRLIARLVAVLHRHLWKCVQLQLEARQQSVKINCKFKVHVCCDVWSKSSFGLFSLCNWNPGWTLAPLPRSPTIWRT